MSEELDEQATRWIHQKSKKLTAALVPATLLDQNGQILSTGKAIVHLPSHCATFWPASEPANDETPSQALFLTTTETYGVSGGFLCSSNHYDFTIRPPFAPLT